jgi:hypothetical protein
MTRADSRAYANDHSMLGLIGDNLLQQGQQGGASAVHDGASTDLDDVHIGQDGEHLALCSRDHALVHEGFAHEFRFNMIAAGMRNVHRSHPFL